MVWPRYGKTKQLCRVKDDGGDLPSNWKRARQKRFLYAEKDDMKVVVLIEKYAMDREKRRTMIKGDSRKKEENRDKKLIKFEVCGQIKKTTHLCKTYPKRGKIF